MGYLRFFALLAVVGMACDSRAQGTKEVWLDELDLSCCIQDWGLPQADRSVLDTPLTVGGVVYGRGVGTHSISRMLFGLGGDVLLGIKEIAPKYKNKLIALGTLAFLIGHFFYLASFYKAEPTFSIIPYIAAFVITAIIAIIMKARQQDVHSLRVLFLRHCALRLRLGLYALSHALADIYYNHNRFGCVCNQRLGARVRLFHARKEKEPARYN